MFDSSLTLPGGVWSTAVCAAPWTCLYNIKEPVLHLYVSLYKRCYAVPGCVCLHEPELHLYICFCATPESFCLQSLCFNLHDCPQGTARTWACPWACAVPGAWCGLQNIFSVSCNLFWNRFVCFYYFGKGSKHKNKPKQTKNNWFHETNQKTAKTIWVSVWTENIFCLFRRHSTPHILRAVGCF